MPNITDKLLEILNSITAFDNHTTRSMLLNNLPPGPVSTINRETAKRNDLYNIIKSTESMGILTSGELALAVLIKNALPVVRGAQHENELQALLEQLHGEHSGIRATGNNREQDTDYDQKLIHILHLSDIHIETKSEANMYRMQLQTDLKDELGISHLQYMVISGDIANKSTQAEYDAAIELVQGLIDHLELDAENIIIVPGNHDLNWDLSKNAYTPIQKNKKLPIPLPGKYIPTDKRKGAFLRKDEPYKKRFEYFDKHFFQKLFKDRTYPKDYSQQGILHAYPSHRILFLALNSCYEIDHYYTERSGISMDALVEVFDQLEKSDCKDWLKIAVWHHFSAGRLRGCYPY